MTFCVVSHMTHLSCFFPLEASQLTFRNLRSLDVRHSYPRGACLLSASLWAQAGRLLCRIVYISHQHSPWGIYCSRPLSQLLADIQKDFFSPQKESKPQSESQSSAFRAGLYLLYILLALPLFKKV